MYNYKRNIKIILNVLKNFICTSFQCFFFFYETYFYFHFLCDIIIIAYCIYYIIHNIFKNIYTFLLIQL